MAEQPTILSEFDKLWSDMRDEDTNVGYKASLWGKWEHRLELLIEIAGLWPTALSELRELAHDSQGEWAPVQPEYAPAWTHGYKRILEVIDDVLERRGDLYKQVMETSDEDAR